MYSQYMRMRWPCRRRRMLNDRRNYTDCVETASVGPVREIRYTEMHAEIF